MPEARGDLAVDTTMPVGTVLAYAGRVPGSLADRGWLVCDGSVVRHEDQPELYAAIYFNFGQVSDTQFNLPDLRGLFVRATCPDPAVRAQRDPSWERRTALNPNGNTREKVGSYQPYGTGKPQNAFKARVEHLNIKKWHDDKGCADRPGNYNDDSTGVDADGGGDLETRPVNKYVYFIVKAATKTRAGEPVRVPVGAIVPYAGPAETGPPAGNWERCEGQARATVGKYAPLFQALEYAHGRDGDNFVLPDYRGWFLRGVTGSGARYPDPDASRRTAAKPGGNAGNDVGSQQEWATALPNTPLHTVFKHLPSSDASKLVGGNLWNLLRVNGGSGRAILTGGGGGDSESRPVNVGVDFYICVDPTPPGGDTETFPIGGVATVGEDLPEGNGYWVPCDGRKLNKAEYAKLHAAVGDLYGATADEFGVPDHRGRFLRGAAYDTGIGPASKVGDVQAYATGRPRTADFSANVPRLPSSTVGAHGATNNGNAGDDGTLEFDPWSSGGDPDTRPNNAYLNLFIRAR